MRSGRRHVLITCLELVKGRTPCPSISDSDDRERIVTDESRWIHPIESDGSKEWICAALCRVGRP